MQLNYKSFGSGPALIILHGLFGSLDNWQTLAKRYAEHFSVYIVDQRNHGKSPHTDGSFTYEQLAEDLLEFMEQQGMYAAHLLGHSMGGKTVMQFATENETMVEKMIVADMSTRTYPAHHEAVLAALAAFPFGEIETRKEATAWMGSHISDLATQQFLLKSLDRRRGGLKGFAWKFNFEVLNRDYENILQGIETDFPVHVPALFLRGGNSPYVKDIYFDEIRERFPEAEFDTVAGAGHWLHAEKPEIFYEKSLAFLLR